MFKQAYRSSDSESVSSETSDVTSRRTTSSGSWSDSAPEEQQINRLNIRSKKEDRPSTSSSATASDNTVISKKSNMQNTNNNQSNQVNTPNQQQQQQQAWVNPYWGLNGKPGAAVTESGTNKISNNTNTQSPTSPTQVKQLIPGSILINDQGEIDNLSSKKNTQLDSSTSSNTFNPGGKQISNGNGAPGGYLSPTHIQRQIVTSPPGLAAHPEDHFGYKRSHSSSDADTQNRPDFSRQQTFPAKTDHNIQPWVNPYWPTSNQTNSQFTQENNTIPNKNSQPSNNSEKTSSIKSDLGTILPEKSTSPTNTWQNPYWKDAKTEPSTVPKQEDQPWENPYWKDAKTQPSTVSKQEGQSWENPYWKDSKSPTSTQSKQNDPPSENPNGNDSKSRTSTQSKQNDQPSENPDGKDLKSQTATQSKQNNQPSENLYGKDKNTSNQSINDAASKKSLQSEYELSAVPSFYERIYPSNTANIKRGTVISREKPKPIINDKEELSYLIDNQGIAHYRSTVPSSSGTTETVNYTSVPKKSQYPVSTPQPPSAPLTAQTSNAALLSHPPSPPLIVQKSKAASLSHPSKVASLPHPSNTPPTSQTPNAVSHLLPFKTASLPHPPNTPPKSPAPNAALLSQKISSASPLLSNLDNYLSSTSSSAPVLTVDDVNNIQHVLHLLDTKPGAVPVVKTSNQVPSSNISYHNDPSIPLDFLSTLNQQQQSQQQPPPSSSPLTSLLTANQPASPFTIVSNINRGQQSQQQLPSSSPLFSQNMQSSSPPQAFNSNSQKLALFSTPSYPTSSNEQLDELVRTGLIVLI